MPSSSIGGISCGSGKRIEIVSSRFGLFAGRSFNGAASMSVLFNWVLEWNDGSGKSAKLSLGGSSMG